VVDSVVERRARSAFRFAVKHVFGGVDLLRAERQEYVFVLAHMRSGSTLLTHILLGHPTITGIGERDATYSSASDLHLLGARGYWEHRWRVKRYRFVVDQINHSRYIPNDRLLADPRLWSIILVREPEPSITSMVRLFGERWGWTVEKAVDYYRARLKALHRYARIEGARMLVLTYTELTEAPDPALRRIEGFLGLSSSLGSSYPTHAYTGIAGDPSGAIDAGTITRPRQLAGVPIPARTLNELQQMYESLASKAGR
jgi:Sulfotransferase family